LWQAVALNVTLVVGAGVFVTIPLMLLNLPGPYALFGWVAAGGLILVDALFWCELGAALPASGGSYGYLLECYGRQRWGRLLAFLFVWQFLLSGPLELASGLIAMDAFLQALLPQAVKDFNAFYTLRLVLCPDPELAMTISPMRLGCVLLGAALVLLLYRDVRWLGRLTVVFGVGVLAAIAWILFEGALRFSPGRAFDFQGVAPPSNLAGGVGAAMILALYAYLGYYNVCYVGDEVRDPGRTIPRAVLISTVLVVVLFCGLHLAMLGTVSWREVPTDPKQLDEYSLAAAFMRRAHGEWAAWLVTLLLVWSCLGAAFAGLLGYSRIPFGAALGGHFFRAFGAVHPRLRVPHRSLLLVGGCTLVCTFFDLGSVVNALIATRILVQFVAQVAGVGLLRQLRPELARSFRVWLYPLPAALAVAGWLFVFCSADWLYIILGLATTAAGVVAFLLWARASHGWPFAAPPSEAPRSIHELTTEEAYRLIAEHFGHQLPPLDAVENEDWGRDYVLQHFQLHSAEELARAGLMWKGPPKEA
jgi:amino acid transporter